MTRLMLIPCGGTFWTQEGRVAGATNLPLSEQGQQDVQAIAQRLAGDDRPEAIYAGSGQATQETLRLLIEPLQIKAKTLPELNEPDMGLWEGLTQEQLRQRFPRAYKQLTEEPTKVRPPMGEPLDEAEDRLIDCVAKICEKHAARTIWLVVGGLAASLIEWYSRSEQFQKRWTDGQAPEIIMMGEPGPLVRAGNNSGSKG